MTTARQELYDLANEPTREESPKESLTKEDVVSAIHEYSTSQQKAQEEADQARRREQLEKQQAQEKQELQEVSQAVQTSLQEEMSKDKDFAKLVQSSDLPGALVDYIAEVGEPEEAPLIVRELAHSDEYQENLKRSKTALGMKRLIGKIRRDVLTGGSQGKVPPILQKDIPNYNPNTSPSNYDQDYYSDLAMRHGI